MVVLAAVSLVLALTAGVAGATRHPAPLRNDPVPTYQNPVVADNAPDPDVVVIGHTYYAFTTGSLNGPIQLFLSTDLAHWKAVRWPGPLVHDAIWTTFGREWAPGVAEIGNQWVMYYATEQTSTGQQCVTMATAPTVTGPYVNESSAPLVCGAIDPSPFLAGDGSRYLVWKGVGPGGVAEILSEALSPDGQTFSFGSSPSVLITQSQSWESTVENPDLVRIDGTDLLFYSGGTYANASYATGYAVCQGPTGPCQQPLDHPILSSTASVVGPGGATAFRDTGGRWWLAYAAMVPGVAADGPSGTLVRSLRIDPLCLVDGAPVVDGPTTTPQTLQPSCPPPG
jgi:beta-xylosidase